MALPSSGRTRLGQLIVDRRQSRGLSQSKLAKAAGISRNTLANVESGGPRDTETYVYGRIETALNWAPGSISAVLAGGDPRDNTNDDQARLRAIADDPDRPDYIRDRARRLLDEIGFLLAADEDTQRRAG